MRQFLTLICNKSGISQRSIIVFVGPLLFLYAQFTPVPYSSAQVRNRQEPRVESRTPIEENDLIDQAIAAICEERGRDSQGSIPIDQMAVQRPLPLNDPHVVAGKKRAERLLSVAKRLVPSALDRLAAAYNLEPESRKWIVERAKAVNTIKIEVEARDNAKWRPSEPRAIIFGSIFLAGIRSDEAMITVLAHELTHAINGTDQAVQPLFIRVEARASAIMQRSIGRYAAAELTCEMVGIRVMRDQTGTGSSKWAVRRLARSLGKNCVRNDVADETHLSPRETMRILLALEPELPRTVAIAESGRRKPPQQN